MTPSHKNLQSPKSTSSIQTMTLTGLMTATLCLLAPISIQLPFSPIPLSLATFVIYFVIIVLGQKRSFLSVLLYLLLGFAGLPIFSGFTGGVGKLLGPTGGYLIGYLFLPLICGFFVDRWQGKVFSCLLGLLLGTLVRYFFGTIWLTLQAKLSFLAAFSSAVLPFLLFDIVKIFLSYSLGYQVRKRLNRAGL